MVDVLKNSSNWLASKFKKFASQPITYRRGTTDIYITATVGMTNFAQTNEFGLEIRTKTRDFIIDVADLVIDGALVEPLTTDRIIEAQSNGENYTYEPHAPNGEPAFRHADNYRKQFRIHTIFYDKTDPTL